MRRRRSSDLGQIEYRAREFSTAVNSPNAYRPAGKVTPISVDGVTPMDLDPDRQLDSLHEVTKAMGISRTECAALTVVIVESIDEVGDWRGGMSRAERKLGDDGIFLDGQALGMFGMAASKWFRVEAFTEYANTVGD